MPELTPLAPSEDRLGGLTVDVSGCFQGDGRVVRDYQVEVTAARHVRVIPGAFAPSAFARAARDWESATARGSQRADDADAARDARHLAAMHPLEDRLAGLRALVPVLVHPFTHGASWGPSREMGSIQSARTQALLTARINAPHAVVRGVFATIAPLLDASALEVAAIVGGNHALYNVLVGRPALQELVTIAPGLALWLDPTTVGRVLDRTTNDLARGLRLPRAVARLVVPAHAGPGGAARVEGSRWIAGLTAFVRAVPPSFLGGDLLLTTARAVVQDAIVGLGDALTPETVRALSVEPWRWQTLRQMLFRQQLLTASWGDRLSVVPPAVRWFLRDPAQWDRTLQRYATERGLGASWPADRDRALTAAYQELLDTQAGVARDQIEATRAGRRHWGVWVRVQRPALLAESAARLWADVQSLSGALTISARWHREERERARRRVLASAAGTRVAFPAPPVPTFAGVAWTATWLEDSYALAVEGVDMGHCVGGQTYVAACRRGEALIFALRSPRGQALATLHTTPAYELVELRGYRNQVMPALFEAEVRDVLAAVRADRPASGAAAREPGGRALRAVR